MKNFILAALVTIIIWGVGCASLTTSNFESIKAQAMALAQKQSESYLKGEVTKGTITQAQMDQIMKLVNSQTAPAAAKAAVK